MLSFIWKMLLFLFVVLGLASYVSEGIAFVSEPEQVGAPVDPLPTATTVDVSIINFDYSPAIVSIQLGDTVRWTNDGGLVSHTSTSGGPFDATPGSIWDSGILTGGSTLSHVFTSAGEFDYFCTIHPLLMFGNVIVDGSGLQVVAIPDDISASALSSLGVDISVFNFTPANQSGDLWLTVILPSSQEITIPAGFLSFPSNPISGQVVANGRLDLSTIISVPPASPAGHYKVKVKVGSFPTIVIDESSFEFDVPVP